MEFHGEKANLSALVDYYTSSGQLIKVEKRVDKGYHLLLTNLDQLLFDLGKPQGLEIESVHKLSIGEDNPEGIGFVVSKLEGQGSNIAAYTSFQETFWIPQDSNLGCTLATQGAEDSRVLKIEETSAIYDLPSLISHNPGRYDVNFTWFENIFTFLIPSDRGLPAGNRLIDLMAEFYRGKVDRVLMIGERGRGYAALPHEFHVPWTCSRPEGTKFPAGWIEVMTKSEYNSEGKNHYIDNRFLKESEGKRVLVLDDLRATNQTADAFVKVVKTHGGIPLLGTMLDLAYLPPEIRVDFKDTPVYSPFIERQDGVVEYSPEFIEKFEKNAKLF